MDTYKTVPNKNTYTGINLIIITQAKAGLRRYIYYYGPVSNLKQRMQEWSHYAGDIVFRIGGILVE